MVSSLIPMVPSSLSLTLIFPFFLLTNQRPFHSSTLVEIHTSILRLFNSQVRITGNKRDSLSSTRSDELLPIRKPYQ